MKKLAGRAVFLLLCIFILSQSVLAAELVPVGEVMGIQLQDGTVTVSGFDEVLGSAAREAGLMEGDQITKIDDTVITCARDVKNALERADGCVEVWVQRSGEEKRIQICPQITAEGPKLGVYLRQGMTGIGTVTWYDPQTGQFGALGHGVNRPDGTLLPMKEGTAYRASVASVIKGRIGNPGQLLGSTEGSTPLGELSRNTTRGIFGSTQIGWQGKTMSTCPSSEIKTGEATILSTVQGNTVQEYSVEIVKIYPNAGDAQRNMLIKITDPALLETTGGIVQGMSGSPILQNGRIIGAVTHVLVNQPDTGYGIFIENMLDAAG